MERNERELIQRALETNFEVKKLYDRHKRYEDRLTKLSRQPYLTAAEQQEQRKLKLLKLRGVERMVRLAATVVNGEGESLSS
jgi:hypothetical protein